MVDVIGLVMRRFLRDCGSPGRRTFGTAWLRLWPPTGSAPLLWGERVSPRASMPRPSTRRHGLGALSPDTMGFSTLSVISTACSRDSWLVKWLSVKVVVMFGCGAHRKGNRGGFPSNIIWLSDGDGTERIPSRKVEARLSPTTSLDPAAFPLATISTNGKECRAGLVDRCGLSRYVLVLDRLLLFRKRVT